MEKISVFKFGPNECPISEMVRSVGADKYKRMCLAGTGYVRIFKDRNGFTYWTKKKLTKEKKNGNNK
jgi:hypothetical protein